MISQQYDLIELYQYYQTYTNSSKFYVLLTREQFLKNVITDKIIYISKDDSKINGFLSVSKSEDKRYITLLYGSLKVKEELLHEFLNSNPEKEVWNHFFNPSSIPFYAKNNRIHPSIQGVIYPSDDYDLYQSLGFVNHSLQDTYYCDLSTIHTFQRMKMPGNLSIDLYNSSLHDGYQEFINQLDSTTFQNTLNKNIKTNKPVMVALYDNRVVGFMGPLGISSDKRGVFGGIEIQKEFRGMKIGSILFHETCKYFKENNAEYITLFTGRLNNAKYIYEKNGFVKVQSFMTMKKGCENSGI
jgi:ribosomal protein S18 acetylase RimI-like enzyme